MDELLAVFHHEATEKLDEMEAGLMALEKGEGDGETLNAIFRAAHTIKGSAGVVEMGEIEKFTHVLEHLLDQLREGKIQIDSGLITWLLSACDHLRNLLECVATTGNDKDGYLAPYGAEMAATLDSLLRERVPESPAEAEPASEGEQPCTVSDSLAGNTHWHVRVRFGRDTFRQGMEPAAFLHRLGELGSIQHVATLLDALPAADDMDPESCYLAYEVELQGAAVQLTQAAIEQVFLFVRDECELEISMLAAEPVVEQASESVAECEDDEPAEATEEDASKGQPKQAAGKERAGQDSRFVRVQADKLDRLIDLVGELVIAGSSAQLLARQTSQVSLTEAMLIMNRLVEDVRDSSLQLRMVTIGETFNRFHRVVRDTARETGKYIELALSGAETELDKSVVEKLADPLLHMVRNAIDHGIEATEVRQASNKSPIGRVSLNAYHESGHVVIEVCDDGGGLNAERIRAKAIERGLIEASAQLVESDIYNLIFEPGFSTADQITNLSGRGVGMDVVKKSVTALRGTIEARSKLGEGSRFILRLPLTLAMIDGFLVSVQGASYVIPLDNVVECLELKTEETLSNVLSLRGAPLPFVSLRELFEVNGERPARQNVVVVQAGGLRAGIVVDQLLGEFHTVIKPLGTLFRQLRGLAGSTIMGTGDVALIVDVPSLVSMAASTEYNSLNYTASRESLAEKA